MAEIKTGVWNKEMGSLRAFKDDVKEINQIALDENKSQPEVIRELLQEFKKKR